MKYAPILEPILERFIFEPVSDETFLAMNKAVSKALSETGEVAHSQVTIAHRETFVEGTIWILPKQKSGEPGKNFTELTFKFLPYPVLTDESREK